MDSRYINKRSGIIAITDVVLISPSDNWGLPLNPPRGLWENDASVAAIIVLTTDNCHPLLRPDNLSAEKTRVISIRGSWFYYPTRRSTLIMLQLLGNEKTFNYVYL